MPKKSEAPERLPADAMARLREWATDGHYWATKNLRELVDECLDWHRMRGDTMADWLAACRTWIRRQTKWKLEKGERLALRPPKERGLFDATQSTVSIATKEQRDAIKAGLRGGAA